MVRFEAFSGDADELKEEGEEEEGEKEEVGKKVFGGVSVPAVLEVVPQVGYLFFICFVVLLTQLCPFSLPILLLPPPKKQTF